MRTDFIRFVLRYSAATGSLLLLLILLNAAVAWAASSAKQYVGAKRCGTCHAKEYGEWKHSGHARILRKASDPAVRNIPLPAGYTMKSISYVIGGFRWKALFLDRDGYLVTSTRKGSGKNQYNLKDEKWVDYLPGQKVPYDCGGCHTTGYSAQGRQNGLKGIIGTWKGEGIQCEACHGPGSAHAHSSLKTDIKIDKHLCSNCHETEPREIVPVNGVFLAPYTEANQLLKSTMKNMTCIECHNPHRSSRESIKQPCEACHVKIASIYKGSYMHKAGVVCIDCHMPPAGMLAEGDPKTYLGDLKSHLFKIDHHKKFPTLTEHGKKINPGYLTIDYACIRCHDVFESRQWALRNAAIAHRLKATTNVKIMRFQMGLAYGGLFFAGLSVLSALIMKNWLRPLWNKEAALSLHKHAVWITFAIYVIISSSCIYFHFPINDPSKTVNLGWFMVHPVIGLVGLFLYAGKILTVRLYKKGWMMPGLVWGAALFVFWIVQVLTVILSFYNILKV